MLSPDFLKIYPQARIINKGGGNYQIITNALYSNNTPILVFIKQINGQWVVSDNSATLLGLKYSKTPYYLDMLANIFSYYQLKTYHKEIFLPIKDNTFESVAVELIERLKFIIDIGYMEKPRTGYTDDYQYGRKGETRGLIYRSSTISRVLAILSRRLPRVLPMFFSPNQAIWTWKHIDLWDGRKYFIPNLLMVSYDPTPFINLDYPKNAPTAVNRLIFLLAFLRKRGGEIPNITQLAKILRWEKGWSNTLIIKDLKMLGASITLNNEVILPDYWKNPIKSILYLNVDPKPVYLNSSEHPFGCKATFWLPLISEYSGTLQITGNIAVEKPWREKNRDTLVKREYRKNMKVPESVVVLNYPHVKIERPKEWSLYPYLLFHLWRAIKENKPSHERLPFKPNGKFKNSRYRSYRNTKYKLTGWGKL